MTNDLEDLFTTSPNGIKTPRRKSIDLNSLTDALEYQKKETAEIQLQLENLQSLHSDISSTADSERLINDQLAEEKATLESENKELKLKVLDLETQTTTTDKRGYEYWQQRINELEKTIEDVNRRRIEEDKSSRTLDNSLKGLKDELKQKERLATRYDDELSTKINKINNLVETLEKLQGSESQFRLTAKRAEREKKEMKERALQLERELEEWRSRFETVTTKRQSGGISSDELDSVFI